MKGQAKEKEITIEESELKQLKEKSLGERLKWVVKKLNITLKELSTKTGMPYNTLHQYVHDKRSPNVQHIAPLAFYGINLHWLITGDGYPLLEKKDTLKEELKEEEKEKGLKALLLAKLEAPLEEPQILELFESENIPFLIEAINKLDRVLSHPEKQRLFRVIEEGARRSGFELEVKEVKGIEGALPLYSLLVVYSKTGHFFEELKSYLSKLKANTEKKKHSNE